MASKPTKQAVRLEPTPQELERQMNELRAFLAEQRRQEFLDSSRLAPAGPRDLEFERYLAGNATPTPPSFLEASKASRPAFGMYPQMKGKRVFNDREASANAPLSALRGLASGTLGLAGDVESLGRMAIPGVSDKTFFPSSETFQRTLPGRDLTYSPTGAAAQTLGNLFADVGIKGTAMAGTAAAKLAGKGVKGLGRLTAEQIAKGMEGSGPMATALAPVSNRYMFIGPKAETWNPGKAEQAVKMEAAGKTPQEVWAATGTFRGADGNLRQEISDKPSQFMFEGDIKGKARAAKEAEGVISDRISESKSIHPDLFPKQLTQAQKDLRGEIRASKAERQKPGGIETPVYRGNLAEIAFEHPELYKAYPELADWIVKQGINSGAFLGSMSPGEINVYKKGLARDPRSTTAHEFQHAVQGLEGWAPGGNPAMAFQDPEAFKILKQLRKDAATPMSFDDYVKKGGYGDDKETLARAREEYKDYVEDVPVNAQKFDTDLQRRAAEEYYLRLTGEAESRATQARINLTPEQRAAKFPAESYDRPQDELISKPPHTDVVPERVNISDNPDTMQMDLTDQQFQVGGLAKLGKVGKGAKSATRKFMDVDRSTSIMKEPGGNWLGGTTEKALTPLKPYPSPTAEEKAFNAELKGIHERKPPSEQRERSIRAVDDDIAAQNRNEALNNWVDRNLTNYVKKQMATQDDPVRKLAEEGVLHINPESMPRHMDDVWARREKAGYPKSEGVSPLAQKWEAYADEAIRPKELGETIRGNNPGGLTMRDLIASEKGGEWATKAPDTQMVHELRRPGTTSLYTIPSELGFDHIMDVLREDLAVGRIRPEQLNKVSMEQAVRRTYEYDQELASKANAARAAQREGLPVYKEYPEGYRWVELNKPGSFAAESEAMGHSVRGYEPPQGHPDWVEGSGEQGHSGYGHGGWEGIKSGKAKVYSLVNPKGEPHVTIEVGGSSTLTPEKRAAQMESLMQRLRDEGMPEERALAQATKLYPESETLSRITQIKGKSNRAPNEEYQPFVQDFVKSGKWSDVGDLKNAGMVKQDGNYITQKEADEILYKQLNEHRPGLTDELGLTTPPAEGMKAGGAVHMSDNPDTMRLELGDQHFQAGGIAKLLKGTQKVLPAAEREANLQKFLAESKTPMRLYHGTMSSEGNKGQEAIRRIKPSKEGALGSGVYLTPQSEFASTYAGFPSKSQLERDVVSGSDFAKESATGLLNRMNRGAIEPHEIGGNMLPVHAQIKNPLILEGTHRDPMIEALVKLGMDEDKASRMVERAYDQKGYIGKEVQTRAQAQGYDGLMQYRDGDLNEVVTYQPGAVKSAIGNEGTYDPMQIDLNKAKGGAVSISDNPHAMRFELDEKKFQVGGIVKAAKAASKGKGLYSAVDKAALGLKRPMGTGKEFMAEIKSTPGVKATELKSRSLADIEAMPKMTKDKFIKELEARPPIKIEEKVLGEPNQKDIDDLADKLAYQKGLDEAREYSSRGDDIEAMAEENYRLSLKHDWKDLQDQARETLKEGEGGAFHEQYTIPGGENYREILLKMPSAKGEGYPGNPAHFGGEPNILASIRVSDRVLPTYTPQQAQDIGQRIAQSMNIADAKSLGSGAPAMAIKSGAVTPLEAAQYADYRGFQGVDTTGAKQKILHVEEIQSDWHQQGRKSGYGKQLREGWRFQPLENGEIAVYGPNMQSPYGVTEQGASNAESAALDIANTYGGIKTSTVPDAPFKKDWQELAMRKVMELASEGGYDKVALTPGAEQAARYDLSKEISRVEWKSRGDEPGKLIAYDKQGVGVIEKEMNPDELANHVGKDVADRLLNSEVAHQTERGHDIRQLSGVDLQVGGEGMKGFYDKMLPDYLNKMGKQYGVQVEAGGVPIVTTPAKYHGLTEARFEMQTPQEQQRMIREHAYANEGAKTEVPVHSFEVTPQMRQDITEKGLPLYQQIGVPVGAGAAGAEVVDQPVEGMKAGGAVQKSIKDRLAENRATKERKFQVGGAVKALKGVSAAERAAAGRKAAAMIKAQPEVKASEALGQAREKGMTTTMTTQADRTRVGGGNIGGGAFSAISEADPLYAGKTWGVMDAGTAKRLKNLTTPETAWTTMLGSATQLKTNPIVFAKLEKQFKEALKQDKLSPELEKKINQNLALTFGEGADIRDPNLWKQADTFEKRAALADLMMGQGIPPKKGGVSLGGEKSGKGVIFKPTETLVKETEPSLLHPEHGGDVPTFAAGPRLFSLSGESSFRPDLHPGFPELLEGKDLGFSMKPTPTEVYLPEWHKKFKAANPERYPPFKTEKQGGPGYYDLALGVKGEGLPSQQITDEYIRHLIREGFKEGGAVNKKPKNQRKLDKPRVKISSNPDTMYMELNSKRK